MKRFTILTIFAFCAISLVSTAPVQAKTTFKLATVTPDHHAYTMGAKEFAKLVEKLKRELR